ncbi:MAG: HugZ family protein [Alphaproteobacteria bacterium]
MTDTENAPKPAPELLSRRLMRACDRAVLSTALPDSGWPYGSLVMTACDQAARPLLLISDLAEHTTNLGHDNRASLLFDGTAGLDSPLTGARVTVLGTLSKTEDSGLIARYTARHPESEMFAGFADFNFYEMAVDRAHIVAGFGVIHWIDSADLLFDTSGFEDLAAAEDDIVTHMNEDHADAIALYATGLLGLEEGDWKMTGVDPEGCDLRNGGDVARVDFEKPADNAESARSALVRLVKAARAAAAS